MEKENAPANKRGRKKKDIDMVFANILSGLLLSVKESKGIIQDDVAKAIGVSRQALGKWANGETVPDILDLIKISKYFDVSTDYLLGLTEYKTIDKDVKAVCEYIGLSDIAISLLKQEQEFYETRLGLKDSFMTALNEILVNKPFYRTVYYLVNLKNAGKKWIKDKKIRQEKEPGVRFISDILDYDKELLDRENSDENIKCDLMRYKAITEFEKNIDLFDVREYTGIEEKIILNEIAREEAAENAKHNPPKE